MIETTFIYLFPNITESKKQQAKICTWFFRTGPLNKFTLQWRFWCLCNIRQLPSVQKPISWSKRQQHFLFPQESVTIKAREHVGVDDGEWELTRKSCNAIENSLLEGVAGSVDLLTFWERLSLAGLYKLGLLITKTNTRSKGKNKVIKSRSTIVVDHSLVTESVYFFTSPFVQIKSLNDHEGNLAIVYQSERLASADVRGLKIANELVTTVYSWLSPEIPLLTCSVQSRCVLRKDTVLKSVVRGDILVCACDLKNSEVFSYHWQDQTHISSRHGMLIHILCEPIMLLGNISS